MPKPHTQLRSVLLCLLPMALLVLGAKPNLRSVEQDRHDRRSTQAAVPVVRERQVEVVWRSMFGNQSISMLLNQDRANVFVAVDRSTLVCLDSKDGRVKWTAPSPSYPVASPISAIGLGPAAPAAVFVASRDRTVRAMNKDNGRVMWTYFTQGVVTDAPVLSPDGYALFFTDNSGAVHAVRSSTGDRMWAYTPGDRHLIWSPLLSPDGGSLYVMSSATGTIYAMRTRDGSMIGVSPGTGKEADGQVLSSPSLGLSGRILYVPTDKRTAIKAIDTWNGTTLWTFALPPNLTVDYNSAPIESRGVVYVLSNGGALTALSAPDGKYKRQFMLTPPTTTLTPEQEVANDLVGEGGGSGRLFLRLPNATIGVFDVDRYASLQALQGMDADMPTGMWDTLFSAPSLGEREEGRSHVYVVRVARQKAARPDGRLDIQGAVLKVRVPE